MASDNSAAIRHTYSDGGADLNAGEADFNAGNQPYQVLEVQMIFYMRVIDGVSRFILHETEPIRLGTALFNLPLHEQNDDPVFLQIYIVDLLSSINIPAVASEIIAGQIASYILLLTEENRDANFHVTAIVDNILFAYATPWLGGGGEIGESPASVERFRMEKLEENGEEDELGTCCICLDEINCKKCDAVKIPCGHVYHKACISTWLHHSDSCPLCRRSLPLKEGSH